METTLGYVATEFTPYRSLAGGVLIGAAAVLLMAGNGRIAGISGIVSRLLPPFSSGNTVLQSLVFVIGLLLAVPIYLVMTGAPIVQNISANLPLVVIAGILVGAGTTIGSGCTSGHGICGNSRLSARSLVATLTFIASGVVVVTIMRHVIGG